MNKSTRLLVLCLGSLCSACAQKSIAPTTFTPEYQTQLDSADVATVRPCAALSGVDVENGLTGAVVGKRTLESSAMPAQNISMTGNPTDWVRAASSELFKRARLNTRDNQGPRLKLKLAAVDINENVHVNSGYDGRVTLDAALINAKGQSCWEDRVSGDARNYGHSGTAISYRETVNHALDRAIMAIVADKRFQDAACGSCRP